MKSWFRIFVVLFLARSAVFAQPVDFHDVNLKAAVEMELGVVNPTQMQMLSLSTLTDPIGGITDLEGLGYASNLEFLALQDSQINDLSSLGGLTKLQVIYLDRNQIMDLSPLGGLPKLRWLSLDNNLIFDFSPLADLTTLEGLYLQHNQILDLSPLAGLTNLEWLALDNNQIIDLSSLGGLTKLELLALNNNQINDLSPMAGLTNLNFLYLQGNQISALSPLAGLTKLSELGLQDNQISDLSPLAALKNVDELGLQNNHISDISPLASLMKLQSLALSNNQISDLSPLAGLPKLVWLGLDNNRISDLSLIADVTTLWELRLAGNPLCLEVCGDDITLLESYGTTVFHDASAQCPTVPDLVGMSEGAAESILTGASLVSYVWWTSSDTVPDQHVIRQEPGPGAVIPPGSSVEIYVSTGPLAGPGGGPDPDGDPWEHLLGHWKLDGNLNDAVASAQGTFTGGTPVYGTGMYDQALLFDGIDNSLELPQTESLPAYTIAAWIKPDRINPASVLARTNSAGTSTAWSHQIRINDSQTFEHYTWDTKPRLVTGTTVIEPDTWYYLAVTAHNDGDMRLYVNGREEGAATIIGTLWPDGDRYQVGARSGDAMGWFAGMVDDIRIYDDVLSAFQILSVMLGEPWPRAWNAAPRDGALLASTDVDLTWSPGAHAVSHEVYLSNQFADVNEGTAEAFQGKLLTTSLATELVLPGGLEKGTIYYWRVDEINDADPSSPWKGDVWRFTTLPDIEITDPHLLGRWTFDEGIGTTAFDWSGYGHHGALHNGAQWVLDGYNGSALRFDGRDDFVSVPLDVSETEYSAALWFRTTNAACGLMCVVQDDLGGGGHDRHIYLESGRLKARLWNTEIISTELNVADGLWHHVVHSYGGASGGQKLYVDGVLRASGFKTQSDFDWQQRINIGFSNDAAVPHFDGLMDDVYIFDKALTEGKIDALILGDAQYIGSPLEGSQPQR